MIAAARASEPDVLLLHAGDVFQGDLFFNVYFGVPELQRMAAIGFDAMAVGNHEFDLGPEELAGILTQGFASGSGPAPLGERREPRGAHAVRVSLDPQDRERCEGRHLRPHRPRRPDEPERIRHAVDPDVVAVASQQAAALRASGAEIVVLLRTSAFRPTRPSPRQWRGST